MKVTSPSSPEKERLDPACSCWILAAGLVMAGALWMQPYGAMHTLGNIPMFLVGASLMLAGFLLALRLVTIRVGVLFGVAILARCVLLFQAPGDDLYRYIWEGRMVAYQVNPYVHAPGAPETEPLRDGLWKQVQHPEATAIYPPLAELVFAGVGLISASVFFFKLIFALADLVTGFLLYRRFGGGSSLLYLWNPLALYCFAGGGHYDSLFLLAVVAGWSAWEAGHKPQATVWLGAAVALKWMALPLLGWVMWRNLQESWRRGILLGILGAAPLVLSWVLLCGWTGEWTLHLFSSGFSQFARSTELFPRIVAWVWEASRYQNTWFLFPMALAWAAVILRGKTFASAAEWSFFFSLILSPLVHAWYFTWLLPFAVVTRNLGTVLLSFSGFIYFVVYHRVEADPNIGWFFTPLEIACLWGPFVLGFVWTRLKATE